MTSTDDVIDAQLRTMTAVIRAAAQPYTPPPPPPLWQRLLAGAGSLLLVLLACGAVTAVGMAVGYGVRVGWEHGGGTHGTAVQMVAVFLVTLVGGSLLGFTMAKVRGRL